MPTGHIVHVKTTIPALIYPCRSVGAHLAAKLSRFQSDERTLTDELCDMLAIWLEFASAIPAPTPWPTFELTLSKTTPREERKIGADLELIIRTPLGFKKCLLQAKVLETTGDHLRNIALGNKTAWNKLRSQLRDMRRRTPDLAFLLVYVPADLLDWRVQGFPSYEQGFHRKPKMGFQSYWGATVVPVNKVLKPLPGRGWLSRSDPLGAGIPIGTSLGVPFWKFLLDVLLCGQGTWEVLGETKVTISDELESHRRLTVGVSGISVEEWRKLQARREEILNWPDSEVAES